MFDLHGESRDACEARRRLRTGEGRAGRFHSQAAHLDACDNELMRRPERGRQERGVEAGDAGFRILDASDQHEAADFHVARMRGIHPVAVHVEDRARGCERLFVPVEVA